MARTGKRNHYQVSFSMGITYLPPHGIPAPSLRLAETSTSRWMTSVLKTYQSVQITLMSRNVVREIRVSTENNQSKMANVLDGGYHAPSVFTEDLPNQSRHFFFSLTLDVDPQTFPSLSAAAAANQSGVALSLETHLPCVSYMFRRGWLFRDITEITGKLCHASLSTPESWMRENYR